MNGTLTRSIGRDMHASLEIANPHEDLTEGATLDVQPESAAQALAKAGLLVPGKQAPKADPEKVKAVAKEPAIAQGK